MTRARLLAVGLLLALFAPVASGCELVADFDRGKIPKPVTDSGVSGSDDPFIPPPPGTDAGSTQDAGTGTVLDGGDGGGGIGSPPNPSDAG